MKKSVKSGIVESLMAHENFSKIAQRIELSFTKDDNKEGTNYSNLRLEKQKISSGTLDTILKTKSSSSPEKSENGTTARINLQSISNQQLEFIGKNSNEYVDYQTKNMVNELIYLFSQWNEYGTENSLHKITQIKELLDLYIKVLASKDENRIFLNTVNILVENNNWDELSENQLKQFITELKKFDDGVITWDRVGMFSKQVKRLELDFISNGKEEK